jgi:hypothetical protein
MASNKVRQRLAKVGKVLEELREELFECSRDCVKDEEQGEWHTAERLFDLAKRADAFRREVRSIVNGATSPVVVARSTEKNPRTEATPTPAQKPSRKRQEDYPKYSVRSNALIKVGLGRDRRSEYEQVVPRAEFDKIIARLGAMSGSGKEFTAEEVQSGLDCPVYQTYIVLSLLRQFELLDVPRRGAYKFRSPQTFTAAANEIWMRLQTA